MCNGGITSVALECGQETIVANPLASDEESADEIHACTLDKLPVLKQFPDHCYGDCTVPVLQCALENCLVPCGASGAMGATCEKCRIDSGCQELLYCCAQTPSPF